ncbi:hypothetical protein [Candidatus Entotheonella palauensis]|uniref:Uncharacterized protein n=1 Tax=Candidatus Entotheonella gemina TaxID=1429439 RepID=W4M8G7_9BACT|nr:hypothetical protein [Candidatus Entotheonella palauensis]ETX06495.1 MAG: hypothetical protein ETSY2_16785 [Candidatus Entotheonella gemina]
MRKVRPETLSEDTVAVLQVQTSTDELERLVPVKMHPLDPLSEPEPSIGALIQLQSGDLIVATYGQETHTLLIEIPESKSIAKMIKIILNEIPINKQCILWQANT